MGILSKGYGRKSLGFNYVKIDSNTSNVGDESLQIKKNNANCIVAVNNNRNKGVKKMLIDHPDINLILLDDGFQHRWINAGLNIITTPFHNPFTKDNLFPLGRLRENIVQARRADIILVTKTPKDVKKKQKDNIIKELNLQAHQKGYFSSITYHKYKCINHNTELENTSDYSITLVTGIADPLPLVNYLKKEGRKVNLIKFPDHYNYTAKDIDNILLAHQKNKTSKKLILTTEKDAVKLIEFKDYLKDVNIYILPIVTSFNEQEEFNTRILDYVKKNKRNNLNLLI